MKSFQLNGLRKILIKTLLIYPRNVNSFLISTITFVIAVITIEIISMLFVDDYHRRQHHHRYY